MGRLSGKKKITPSSRKGKRGVKQLKKDSGRDSSQVWGRGDISGPRHEYRESLILGLVKGEVEKGSIVLDAGCGSGSLLFKLADLGYRVYGLEQSREYVREISRTIKSVKSSNVLNVRQGSIANLPYPEKSFDLVVSGEVLEHVADDAKAIREFFRVLKPGGTCVVSVPADPELWDFTDEWAGHLRRYTKKDLVVLFESKGFVVKDVRFWGFPFVRLYHRYVYLPYLKKRNLDAPPDAGFHRMATKLLSVLFRIDSLFGWAPFGVGLILTARKPNSTIDLKANVKLRAIGCPS